MVRDLDLKKPPSIAESIDWARALLLLGAQDIDAKIVQRHHLGDRQAPHGPRHRRRARRREARCPPSLVRPVRARASTARPSRGAPAWPARSWSSARSCAARASRSAPASCSTPSPPCARAVDRAGRLPRGARRDAGQIPGRPPVFELVFDRFFFRAAELAAIQEGMREEGGIYADDAGSNMETLRRQVAAAVRDGNQGADARPRAAGDRGLRPPGRGLGRHRRRRAAHPPRAGAAHRPQPDLPPHDPRRDGLPRDEIRRFEQLLREELERAQIQRTEISIC